MLILFRCADERTELRNLATLARFFGSEHEIRLIRAQPFEEAVRQMISLAAGRGCLAVDADIVITDPASICRQIELNPNGEGTFWVQDRFRGAVPAGLHWHGPPVIEEMRRVQSVVKRLKKPELHQYRRRPESFLMLRAMAVLRQQPVDFKKIVATHDFDQWYADIWAKYLYRGWRDGGTLARYAKNLSSSDPEERTALRGLKDSQSINQQHWRRDDLRRLFAGRAAELNLPDQAPLSVVLHSGEDRDTASEHPKTPANAGGV